MEENAMKRRKPLVFDLALALGLCLALTSPPAPACTHAPPEPACTKALALALAGPPVVLLPSGGAFDVPALVVFQLLDFPAGTGICPAGPYAVDVAITADCSGPADGSGQLLGAAIVPGFNVLSVAVTVPAGPPRLCLLEATATLALSDGMTLSETADGVACLGEPAPAKAAAVPRLDLRLLGPPGSEIARTHPGDQAVHVYRVTNNDPSASYSGVLDVDMVQEARQPGAGGPMAPGTAVISLSDPVLGDHFPIAFDDGLDANGCVPLPGNPLDPAVPTLTRTIVIGPGQSIDVPVYSRHWGMCADGSCARSTLVLEGDFSDATPGLACSGFVTAADVGAAPDYGWDDAGEVATFPPPGDPSRPLLTLTGSPRPGFTPEIDAEVTLATLHEDGVPADPPAAFSGAMTADRGRIQLQFPGSFEVDSFFDVYAEITFTPGAGNPLLETRVFHQPTAGAPTGFFESAPFAGAWVTVGDDDGIDYLVNTIQLSAVGIDDLGARRRLEFDGVAFGRLPGGTGLSAELTGGTVTPGLGSGLDAIELVMDFRGFLSPQPQGAVIFEDGFESGNVSRWSLSVP
jgi:hypothetical protein